MVHHTLQGPVVLEYTRLSSGVLLDPGEAARRRPRACTFVQ